MANINNWLAMPNIELFKIVWLVTVAACIIACFVIPPAWSQELEETGEVENCTSVEMCLVVTGPDSKESCNIGLASYFENPKGK